VSPDPLDDLDEFVSTVTLTSGQTNQLPRLGNEDGLLWSIAHHGDTSSSAEVQKPFLAKSAKRPEHRVGVDPEHGSQVPGRRQSFTWLGFPVGDGPADLCCHLLMQGSQFVKVNLDMDIQHSDNYASTMSLTLDRAPGPSGTEALIKEARRHRRRRWLGGVGFIGVVGLVLAVLVTLWPFGSSPLRPLPRSGTGSAAAIETAMQSAGPTNISVIATMTTVQCPQQGRAISRGSFDIAEQSIALTTVSVRGDGVCRLDSVGNQVRQFGTSQYWLSGCRTQGCRPWYRGTLAPVICGVGFGQDGEAVSVVQTPYLLTLIAALPTVQNVGTRHFHGQVVTEYRGATTLKTFQLTAQRLAPPGRSAVMMTAGLGIGNLPPATSIPIEVTFSVDSSDRLVGLTASQPFYLVPTAERGPAGGFQLQTSSLLPPAVGPPYQGGSMSITAELSNFGATQAPMRPLADRVAVAPCRG
jgi:hypothetical protein